MAKTLVALYDTREGAEAAIRDLKSTGISTADISLLAKQTSDPTGDRTAADDDHVGNGAATGAVGGTLVGGVLGLLVGVGALAIPGIGPVLAAGTLATVLGSAALGAGIRGRRARCVGGEQPRHLGAVQGQRPLRLGPRNRQALGRPLPALYQPCQIWTRFGNGLRNLVY